MHQTDRQTHAHTDRARWVALLLLMQYIYIYRIGDLLR